jgi:hypothetical protein
MKSMRAWLYSRWFFAFLALTSILDLIADLAERYWNWTNLNDLAIGLDVLVALLTGWMFIDLQRRGPKRGGGSRG